MSEPANLVADMQVDLDNLYREESFTDLRIAQIRRLTPVKPDGTEDDTRKMIFIGETQLMSARGPLPIHTPIDATDLAQAFEKFPEAINVAVENMIEEAKELQRQEATATAGGVTHRGPGSGGRRTRWARRPGWPRWQGHASLAESMGIIRPEFGVVAAK
ncbi:MAG: hypothetical protein JRE71_21785 [Deltaproteobacteria bacterium]|nr:hypothetical protein [Deltaproteobacteria bacterium]